MILETMQRAMCVDGPKPLGISLSLHRGTHSLCMCGFCLLLGDVLEFKERAFHLSPLNLTLFIV
jgi:hypothetical protein